MGRPKLKHPKSHTVRIRAQVDEHRAWMRAAKRAGLSLSAWIRELANTASGHRPKDGE